MKKFIRIHLLGDPQIFFDLPIPDGFTMQHFVSAVQSTGYVQAEGFYIPQSAIKCAAMVELKTEDPLNFTKPYVVQ